MDRTIKYPIEYGCITGYNHMELPYHPTYKLNTTLTLPYEMNIYLIAQWRYILTCSQILVIVITTSTYPTGKKVRWNLNFLIWLTPNSLNSKSKFANILTREFNHSEPGRCNKFHVCFHPVG